MNDLDRHLSALRRQYAGARSSAQSRESLMRRFEASCPPQSQSRRGWVWTLPLAAALLFGFILVRHHPAPVSRPAASEEPGYLVPADSQQEDGFIAVPYVPPLATGELVRVVHTELYPSALASLGVNVDPTLTAGISADLLMGEDGFPRAVRVSTEF